MHLNMQCYKAFGLILATFNTMQFKTEETTPRDFICPNFSLVNIRYEKALLDLLTSPTIINHLTSKQKETLIWKGKPDISGE